MKNQKQKAEVTGNTYAGRVYHPMKVGTKVDVDGMDFHGHFFKFKCIRKRFFGLFNETAWIREQDLKFMKDEKGR